MGMLTALKDAVARVLGYGQGDEGELVFATLEDARSGLEPPSRQEVVNKLLDQRQNGEGGNTPEGLQGQGQGENPRVEPPLGEKSGEPVLDISALLSGGAEDDAEEELEVGTYEIASAGYGDFSLDIFRSEKIVIADELDLPEGLVDIDVEKLLEECDDVMERLAALPKHQMISPGERQDQA